MTHRERLETAWRLREPDRVPIEIRISPHAQKHPRAEGLLALIEEHADNFVGVPGADFGFFGFPTRYTEEVIEDAPGQHYRLRRTHDTDAGRFTAITYHPAGDPDYHWEKRYVSTTEDLRRLTETPRQKVAWNRENWAEAVRDVGERGLPILGLFHPLGTLVRLADMHTMYAWFRAEPGLVHAFLAASNAQVAEAAEGMLADGIGPYFGVTAHEMCVPPWMGHDLFSEFVSPYDRHVNGVVHKRGGRIRAHCHGNCMDFLETFSAIGLDAVEPLEHSPTGDVDLAEAKRRVGDRMLLSGNIASEQFVSIDPPEVRRRVKDAIRAAGHGGGYTLRTSGGYAGTSVAMEDALMAHVLGNCEAYIMAGLEYGVYPLNL